MRRVGAWAGACVVVGAFGCTPIERPSKSDQPAAVQRVRVTTAPAACMSNVITTLQTRDHEVTVYAGQAGLSFTVAAAGGTVLASQLSEIEFAQSFPGLFSRYDSAFAGERVWLDASAQTRSPVAATQR